MQKITATLAKWSRGKFHNAIRQIDTLKHRLTEMTNKEEEHHDKEESRNVIAQIEALWRQEEMYWSMRSRIKWMRWGDQNTKFFHAMTVQRRVRNRISMLRTDDNTWSREPSTIKQHIRDFYQSLYTAVGEGNYQPILDQCITLVNDEMNESLIKPISEEEVRDTVFQLGPTKAPGPNGLNGLFYQSQWSVVHEDIFSLVDSFSAKVCSILS